MEIEKEKYEKFNDKELCVKDLSKELVEFLCSWRFHPNDGFVVLQEKVDEKSKGGLLLSDMTKARLQKNVNMGWILSGNKEDFNFGDRILWSHNAGLDSRIPCPEGPRVQIIHDNNIMFRNNLDEEYISKMKKAFGVDQD